ncbi:hypothetical protein ALC56_03121 [Trachymyrmex septentrionalis]|uniref:Uncharacterized protein n=1 Tax=Trachymyrmex septentrionalis TaxID=34720 RepID=A0A151K017_9HYME|nr:hypothetical protein ALC56_03121 [Trachymyrmex septentrionalis]
MAGNFDIVYHGGIIGMWECRIDMRDIACRISCSETNVHKWIKRWQEDRTIGLKDKWEHNCRLRLTNIEKNAALIARVDSNPFLLVSHSVNQLNLQISNWIAQRRLYKANCYRAAHKIPLTRQHCDNRFCVASIKCCFT